MTTPNDAAVDVFAVLGRLILDQQQAWGISDDAAIAARDAICELVEADREYDAAMRSEADTDGMLRREDARVRRAAALRRFATGGES